MQKKRFALIFLLVFVFVLLLSNPSLEEHKLEVKERIYKREQVNAEQMQNLQNINNWAATGILLNNYFLIENINHLVDSAISQTNYFLFSLTQCKSKGNISTIGIGIFGHVFIWDGLREISIHKDSSLI